MTAARSFVFFIAALILHVACFVSCYAQKMVVFAEPEIMVGMNVANYNSFPESTIRKTYALNIGTYKNSPDRHDHQYYNFPHTGISLRYSDLGNDRELGKEISVVPYISLNASKRLKHSWNFRIGLGASYFTKYYDETDNRSNKAIGSRLNWTFQTFLYHTLWLNSRYNLKLGGGYLHSSNAHTQLPNFGLNSAMVSIACNYYFQKISPDFVKGEYERKLKRPFIQFRGGVGMHEFGSTIGPVGGPKKPVYTYALSYGLLYNQQLKLYSGLFYRYYTSFYRYLKENSDNGTKNLRLESSNISFFIGCEYLLGHVGMNVEGGLNLYKPFYDEFYELYENGNDFNKFRMSMFNTRLGMNLYLVNTNKQPKHNLALGTHINANFGKADFGAVSLTYMKMLK